MNDADAPRRRGQSVRLEILSSPPARRARIRHDAALAALARAVRDAARLTYAETAAVLDSRGKRSWRGKRLTGAAVARLVKEHAA